MAHIDKLLERNTHFATTSARDGITIGARFPVWVITCLDPRTDPAAFLELQLGDATVMRNAGGRVTPALLEDLALISYLTEHKVRPGQPVQIEIAVIHHTQCGTHFLADPDFRRGVADRIGGGEDVVASIAAKAVVHPEETVSADVELLRASTILPATITISGHVYDVTTGLLATIIPAAPMHAHASDPVSAAAQAQ